jgi:hypothetical protein
MSRDSIVIPLRQPEAIDDPLSELAREGVWRMLAQVLIAEADSFVALWKDLKLPDGRDRIVRHGHGPRRAIQTGVGPVEVRRAKVRDRGDVGAEEKIRLHLVDPAEVGATDEEPRCAVTGSLPAWGAPPLPARLALPLPPPASPPGAATFLALGPPLFGRTLCSKPAFVACCGERP